MRNATNDLRSLYRSASRMASSDDVNVLLDFLVEDLINSTELERVLVLRLDGVDDILQTTVYYGFQHPSEQSYQIPFKQVNGLLKKVYTDREPLNVIDYKQLQEKSSKKGSTCGILRDDYRSSVEPNRRPRFNLCVPSVSGKDADMTKYDGFRHYSMMQMGKCDQTICCLLGNVDNFLILPLCDDKTFHGYVLADKSLSGQDIAYDEIRHATALVKHSSYAIGRACRQHGMLKKIAEQLNEIGHLKSYYQSIIQNLRSGLVTVNQFLKINGVNHAAELSLGYRAEELLGKPLDVLLASSDTDRKCFFLDSADEMDTSMGLLSEVPMRRKDGSTFPSEICFSVIADSNDDVTGLSCIFRDITTRRAMEKNLARIDKLASLGELAAGVAHEIKNPLAGIAGAMQIMLRTHDENAPHHFVFQEVLEQVNRLDGFVNDLLLFARPGQTRFTTVNIEEIIDKALLLVATAINKKQITVHKELPRSSSSLQGDAGQLQQVFLNIIVNAIDAMDDHGTLSIASRYTTSPQPQNNGEQTKCTSPACTEIAGEVSITFNDTGHGIDKHSLETIFNPFHTTKGDGTGLGLSISHRIIEQHNGTIAVNSTPEEGTTFAVNLPISCQQEKQLEPHVAAIEAE